MVAALKLQLPSFVNANEAVEREETVEIEIDAGIDVPNYLLVPESEDCMTESEEDLDDKKYFNCR